MKNNKCKTVVLSSPLRWAMLSFLLSVMCVLAGHTAQAQTAISHRPAPISSKTREEARESFRMASTAAADLHMGRLALSESEARQALVIDTTNGVAQEVLAATLEEQGKDQEALQQYQTIVEHYDKQARNLLPYAGLLLKSGQWAQALAVYNQALPHLPDVGPHLEGTIIHDGDVMRANSHFSPDVPEPMALATAIHIARGMVYNNTPGWAGTGQDTEAMAEYAKALQTAPGNALANYYYGVGWHKLAPADRVKFGTAQQARAALQKAVKIGNADVKAAALKALKSAG